MKKIINKSKRGGPREGSGRKPGRTKVGLSVSVNAQILSNALSKWPGKTSALVEKLLQDYAG